MKLFRNKFIIGILCIVAALSLSFVALPAMQKSNTGTYVNAIRLKESVPAGTQITTDMLETVRVPGNFIENGISDPAQIIGRYAKSGMYAGDYLIPMKITAALSGQNLFSAGIRKDKLVVSVALPTLASGVSGKLQPGDVVTVMAVPKTNASKLMEVEPGPTEQAVSDIVIDSELKFLEVCMVTASDGADADVKAESGTDKKNTLPVTVSFYVSESQAKKLAELDQNGTIHLAFVARGKAASQYLPDRVLTGTEAN